MIQQRKKYQPYFSKADKSNLSPLEAGMVAVWGEMDMA